MKITVQAPLTFECESHNISSDLVLFKVSSLENDYNYLNYNKLRKQSLFSSYGKTDNNDNDISLEGIVEKTIFEQFLSSPTSDNLKKISDHAKSFSQYAFLPQSYLDELLLGQKLPYEFSRYSMQLTYSYDFKEVKQYIIENNAIFLLKDASSDDNELVLTKVEDNVKKVFYFEASFQINPGLSFIDGAFSDGGWDKEKETLLNIDFTEDQLVNKLRFLNKMIDVQNNTHIFTKDSFDSFLIDHLENREKITLPYSTLSVKDLLPLSYFKTSDDDWKAPSYESFPIIHIQDTNLYDKIWTEAEAICKPYEENDRPSVYHVAKLMMLQHHDLYQKLGINFDSFCDQYFLSSFEEDGDYLQDEKATKEIVSSIKKWNLNRQLENTLHHQDIQKAKRKL